MTEPLPQDAAPLPPTSAAGPPDGREPPGTGLLRRRHLQLGWTALVVFVLLGMTLEALHGFKVGGYLNVDNATRRLMWTLAHAHGTLLALVNLAFVGSLDHLRATGRTLQSVSQLFVGATVLVPGGFFLGGIAFRGGDPGLGVLLVPIGGVMLVVGLGVVAWSTR